MANGFGTFDLGRAYSQGQQAQYSRLRNALLGQQLEAGAQQRQLREQRRQIRMMTDNAPDAIAQMEARGDFAGADMLRQAARERIGSTMKMLEDAKGWVTDEDTYKDLRSRLLESGAIDPDDMPVDFNRSFFANEIKKLRGNLSKITVTRGTPAGPQRQDIITDAAGNIVREVPYDPKQLTRPRTGAAGGFKASDASEIRRQAGDLFGGLYDPQTGRFAGLTKDQRQKVQSLIEEAEKLYDPGAGIFHGQAVTLAARRLGITVENIRDRAATDPLNLLGQ